MADTTVPLTKGVAQRAIPGGAAILLAVALALAVARPFLPDLLVRVPDWAIPPYQDWMQALFDFIKDDLGLIHVTRTISSILEWFLDVTANLLYGKNRWPYLGPLPWTAVAAVAAVIGYAVGRWRLALLAGGTFTWIALIGQWDLAMQTLSVIAVAAPAAFLLGLVLGVLAWKLPRFEAALLPILAVLQTLPFFTYLLPAVIFFKVGPTAGCVATVVYAIPPMVLMTALGLKKVAAEVVEAGQMSGSTRWQMLRHVYLPSARTEILVGVNQVIMLSLAMVVLTAFIGMPGLGAKLLSLMNSLKLGRSFEIGVTIVLVAVTLDRISKAWVIKQPVHFERGTPWWERNRLFLIGLAAFAGCILLAQVVPMANEIDRKHELSMGSEIDTVIRAILANDTIDAITTWLRGFLTVSVLIPFRDAVLWLPSLTVILALAAAGYAVGGPRSALLAGGFFAIVALTGWWDRAMITLYTVLSAVVIAAVVGLPLGILAARRKKWAQPVLLICDTAQTFPSFIYLIPAIMLFGVNDVVGHLRHLHLRDRALDALHDRRHPRGTRGTARGGGHVRRHAQPEALEGADPLGLADNGDRLQPGDHVRLLHGDHRRLHRHAGSGAGASEDPCGQPAWQELRPRDVRRADGADLRPYHHALVRDAAQSARGVRSHGPTS